MKTKLVRKETLFLLLGIIMGISLTLPINCSYQGAATTSDSGPPVSKLNFALVQEAWNLIQANYVDRAAIKPIPLTYGAVTGMVNALGDTGHSSFLSPEMAKMERQFTAGNYEGIGAEVRMKDGRVVVVAPLDGSPAQKAGLQPGDVIVAVDDVEAVGLSLIQVVQKISGPPNTQVTLSILDPKTGLGRKVTITRATITVRNVSWSRLPGTSIAHLRIAGFSKEVVGDLKQALQKIREEDLKGIILDLRNCPGGLLGSAIAATSQFISEGNVVLVKDSEGNIRRIPVEAGGEATKIPMVTLINEGTASGAEIMAGALKDHGRSTLVGTATFGTGTVLKSFPLSDGSAIFLAVEEWLTPDGQVIWHKGIVPDVVLPLPEGVTPLFPSDEKDMTSQQLRDSVDKQLLKAMETLSGATSVAFLRSPVGDLIPQHGR